MVKPNIKNINRQKERRKPARKKDGKKELMLDKREKKATRGKDSMWRVRMVPEERKEKKEGKGKT